MLFKLLIINNVYTSKIYYNMLTQNFLLIETAFNNI